MEDAGGERFRRAARALPDAATAAIGASCLVGTIHLTRQEEGPMHGVTHLLTEFDGYGSRRRFAEVPSTCPACTHPMEPRRLSAHSLCADDTAVEFVFQCPHDDCRRVFVGEYRLGHNGEYELLHALSLELPVEARHVPA
jgi:hypothetical protein